MAEPDERAPAMLALRRLVGFGRFLRGEGLPAGPGRVLTFCRAAAALDPLDPGQLRLAARATLVSRPEDLEVLDRSFHRYFGSGEDGFHPGPEPAPAREGPRSEAGQREQPAGAGEPLAAAVSWPGAEPGETREGRSAARVVASGVELLRTRDFAQLTEEERRAASSLVGRLAPALPTRYSRRYVGAPRGPRFDLRGTLRRSLRTEGEPFRRSWKRRGSRRRPVVILLDVSGSMAPYGRPLVAFAHATVRAGRRVEAFTFGTRLTRITPLLRSGDPSSALAAVGAGVTDWHGGTRIGESLKELLDGWSGRSALRGSVVILASDGLERGDPKLLSRQIQRLARVAHRLVWVNPLKGSPRYEPLARGMAAALPHIDAFLSGHNLERLEALAAALAAI